MKKYRAINICTLYLSLWLLTVSGCTHKDRDTQYWDNVEIWATVINKGRFLAWRTGRMYPPFVPEPAPSDIAWRTLDQLQQFAQDYWSPSHVFVIVYPLSKQDATDGVEECLRGLKIRFGTATVLYSKIPGRKDQSDIKALIESLPSQ